LESEFIGADEHQGKALSSFQDGVASHSTRSPNVGPEIASASNAEKGRRSMDGARHNPIVNVSLGLGTQRLQQGLFYGYSQHSRLPFHLDFSACRLSLSNDYDPNFIGLSRTKHGVRACNEDFHDQYFYDYMTCMFFVMLTKKSAQSICEAFQFTASY
jgi:hypothetical protein